MIKLKKWWLYDLRPATKFMPEPRIEIRLDWDNDRHHSINIRHPYGVNEVAIALDQMVHLILNDPHLKETDS